MKLSPVTLLVTASCAAIGSAPLAGAADLFPPSWRGQSGSTLQDWSFNGSSATPSPETVNNPYGIPNLTIDINPPFGTGWYNTFAGVYGTRQGFWDIANGSMSFSIPSSPDTSFYQLVQIQVTYWLDISEAPSYNFSPFATQIGSTTTTLVENPAGPGAWYSDLTVWQINSNPGTDLITLLGGANGSILDRVVIDTFAVPEPSTTLLTAVGAGVMLLYLSRRRRA